MQSRNLGTSLSTGIFYFQGVWSSFFPVYRRLKEELDKKSIGDVKVVTGSMGRDLTRDVNFSNKATGGILIALGIYMAHLREVVFGRTNVSDINV